MNVEPATYSIDEVAALLGLARNTVYSAAGEDRLPVPVIKVGRRMVVGRAALDRFLNSGAEACAPDDSQARRLQSEIENLRKLVGKIQRGNCGAGEPKKMKMLISAESD